MAIFLIVKSTLLLASSIAFALQDHVSISRLRSVARHAGHHGINLRESGFFNQTLQNHGDMQYTGEVFVGGQKINAIIDTGSFELLVFSTRCNLCGDMSMLYSENASQHYHPGTFVTEHTFGSGSTQSLEAYDNVQLGDMWSNDQVFWEVVGAAMPVLEEASFQAILGVGPPQSAVELAMDDEATAKSILMAHPTEKTHADAEHYAGVVEHAQNATSLAANMFLHTFSFCLEREVGSNGWFVWNDIGPYDRPSDTFTTINLVGDLYWSAEMTNVKLGVSPDGSSNDVLGCHDKPCSAVFDSGTSLISAPQRAIDAIEGLLAKRADPLGDCSDLTGLPDLEFTIDGMWLSLPPQAYVGQVDDVVTSDIANLMPHLRARSPGSCVPILMSLDSDSQFGPLWVLGMPFFRKYYATFHLENGESPRAAAKSMALAHHDGLCRPVGTSLIRSVQTHEVQRAMSVKIGQVYAPSWVLRAKANGKIRL